MGKTARNEVMITVFWSCYGGKTGERHHEQRGRTTADLGLDDIPDPPFTAEEMTTITRAAKFAALKCLKDRKKTGWPPGRERRMRITWHEGEPGYNWNEKYHLEQKNGSYRFMSKIPGNMQYCPGPEELSDWFERLGVTAVEVQYGTTLEEAAEDPTGCTFPDGVWPVSLWKDWAVAMNNDCPPEVMRKILKPTGIKFARTKG